MHAILASVNVLISQLPLSWLLLFDTQDFKTLWEHGAWTKSHGWLHIISDLGVCSACIVISCLLGYFLLKRKQVPFAGIAWLSLALLLACGTTFLMDAVVFWWPAYRLAGAMKLVTAIISWSTVVALIYIAPRAIALKSPRELEEVVDQRTVELQGANQVLQAEIRQRETAEATASRLAAIVESSHDAVVGKDLEGRIETWNQGAVRLYGYTAEEAVGQSVEILVPAAEREAWLVIMQRLREGEVIPPFETNRKRKDGQLVDISLTISPIFDLQGKLSGASAIARDMSERRKLEEELRRRIEEVEEGRERIRSVMNNVVDGIVTIDENGKIASHNDAAENLFGYTSAELVGANVKQLMPEPYKSNHSSYLRNYLETGDAKIIGTGREVVGLRRDGSTFPMDLAVGEFHHGGRRFFTGVVRDISQSKQTENTLRFMAEASAALASLVDFESTLRTVVRLAVPFFADMCVFDQLNTDGRLTRLAAGTTTEQEKLLESIAWDNDADLQRGPARVMASGEAEIVKEFDEAILENVASDAKQLAALRALHIKSYMCLPLVVRGETLGVFSFVLAGSNRHYDREDIAVAEDLVHRAAVAIDNAKLYAAVQEADQRKENFLATLAHELRNPLAPIRSGLDLLEMEGVDEESARWTRRTMRQQIRHMVHLIDDLLDVSRITRGKIRLQRQNVELTEITSAAVEESKSFVESRQHQLTLELPEQSPHVYADPVRIAQVLANLLNNSAKYTDPGGQIVLYARTEENELILGVRDSGIGIDPAIKDNLFDMFAQADATTERVEGGLGIGLTLVRELVQLHGGTVEVLSEGLDQGSDFIVRLPGILVAPEVAPPVEEPPEKAATPNARRVLVADDNTHAARMLSEVLSAWGHEVHVTYDGFEAIEAYQEYQPEVVLLDVGMPCRNGYEVAEAIRAMPNSQQVLLAAVTGYGRPEDMRRSKQAGFDLHLVKPVSLERLREIFMHPKLLENGSGGSS